MMKTVKLSVGYGRKPIISNIELELEPGKLTLVVGPNASGKTTFLKTLAGLLKPVLGTVYISNEELSRMNSRQRARRVAALLTGRPDVGNMTVEEVVAMGRYPWTGPFHYLGKRDEQAVEEAMMKTNITHLRERKVSDLSDGQFQRVMIAKALAQEPQLLILDEPTTHLDAKSRLEIITLLRKLAHKENITITASTHEIELALRFADKLILIESQRISVFEDAEELIQDKRFHEAFGFNGCLHLAPTTLSIEFREVGQKQGKRVFVIAGAGTGARIYRALLKTGCDISTGVLHQNDVDYHVAVSLGIETVAEKPFAKISDYSFQKAAEKILLSEVVLYTSPPLGETNIRNVELLRYAVENNIPTFALSQVGKSFEGVETVFSVKELVTKVLQPSGRTLIRETAL